MSFTTVEAAILFCNQDIDALSDMQQAQVSAMILYIDGVICNYCGWNLLATDYVNKRFDGDGSTSIDLRVNPINSVLQVRERASDLTFTDYTSQIEIFPEDGVIQLLPTAGVSFTAGIKNEFVSFNAGFTEGSIPYDLQYAANYLVGVKAQKNTAIDIDFNSIELPLLVQRVLDRYRLVSIF